MHMKSRAPVALALLSLVCALHSSNAVDVPLPTGRGVGIGALAVGNVKYQTESGLFRRMIEADEVLALDFRDAFILARTLVPEL